MPSRSCLALSPRALRNVGGMSSGPWGAFGAHLEVCITRSLLVKGHTAALYRLRRFMQPEAYHFIFVRAQAVGNCGFLHKGISFFFVGGSDSIHV